METIVKGNKKVKMKKILIIFVILFISSSLFSGEKNESKILFEKGTVQLSRGNYSKSLDYFNILNEQKEVSPELFYNMGIAYFHLKKYGMSRLYFERAKFLSPSDEDILYNLKVLKKVMEKTLPQEFKISTGVKGWSSWFGGFKISVVIIISTILFILLLISGFLFIWFFDVKWGVVSFLVFMIWFVSMIFTWEKINYDMYRFVVVTNDSSLYSSPDNESKIIMNIPEGVKALIVDSKVDWYKIKMKNGVTGWTQKAKTKMVILPYFWSVPSVVHKILSIPNG